MEKLPTKIVSITGAGGNIGYILSGLIAEGRLLGPGFRVFLKMIEVPGRTHILDGVIAEIEDSASPYFAGATATDDAREGFRDADYILLVGAKPRLQGMERKDLLVDNAKIFATQGQIIDEVASPNAKIVVVGNPANTNAYILAQHAPKIPKKNITSLTRLDFNRALGVIAKDMNAVVSDVLNPVVWGNHSPTMGIDLSHVTIRGEKVAFSQELSELIQKSVQNRGALIINKRGQSSCWSAAIAICDHIRDWVLGTAEGKHICMGVFGEGNQYGIPEDLNFSFPVVCKNGEWSIVQGLQISEQLKERLQLNINELNEERTVAGSL